MLSVLIALVLAFLSIPTILFAAGIAGIDFGTILDFLINVPLDNPIASIIISFLMVKGGPVVWFLLHVLRAIRDKFFDEQGC